MKKEIIGVFFLIIVGILSIPGGVVTADVHTITDMAGNSVELPTDLTRVVSIEPFTSQFIHIIGADDKLVTACLGPANRELVNKTEPNLASLPSIGCKSINVEQLLALDPEVVISEKTYTEVNEAVQNVGVPLIQLDIESPENLIKSYRILGEAFGKEKEAENFITYYQEKMNLIRENAANISESDKKSVYFGQMDPLSTLGDDYYEAGMAHTAGLKNAAIGISGGDNKVTMDQIYLWNPDAIILLPYCSMSVDELMADPSWQSLPAVQNKQVFRMPKYLMNWELPVPESILGTLWLQSTFYPEQVTYDLYDEIISFYEKFYDIDLSSGDVDTILTDQSPIVVKKPAA